MKRIFFSIARNTVFANILMVFILFGGWLAIINMTREIFPDIQLDVIRVAVVWPGANPEEVEEGICRKIEESLDGIEGIKDYHTVSSEHAGLALVEVMEGYDVQIVKEKVRNAVDAIATFPTDAERPLVEQFILRIQVMLLSLTGPELSELELREHAEKIKDELRALPEVTHVSIMNARPHEIRIEISEERLREYGVTFEQVSQVVRANSMNLPGGVMRTQGEEIRIRTIGRNYTGADFSELVVMARPDGSYITLGRLARIIDGFSDDTFSMRFNGQNAVTLRILKTKEEDTLAIDKAVLTYVNQKKEMLPEGVSLEYWARNAPRLQSRISLLLRNGIMGLMLVFALLWLFLDIRLSFWAGMGMPISIMGSFMAMWYFGATVNMMSLFAMITVLGIIVDDAIVVGEAIYVARQKGMPPLKAAVEGVTEVGMPVIAAVTTTIVAFMPLFFVSGVMGRLITVVPLVVVSALTVSLLESLFLLPAHLSHLPDPNARIKGRNIFIRVGLKFHQITNTGLEHLVERYYLPAVTRSLRWRYVSFCMAIVVMMFTWGIMDSGWLLFENFPKLDNDTMAAAVEFPSGTPRMITEAAVVQMEKAIKELAEEIHTPTGVPLIRNMFSMVGGKMDGRGSMETGAHLATVRVELLNSVERDIHVDELTARWEEKIGKIIGALALTIRGDDRGPSGQPIEVWLQGKDLDRLLAASADLKSKLAEFKGVYQIQDDYRVGNNEIQLALKPEARSLGFHVADLARHIFTGFYGEELMRMQRGRDEVRVRVRYAEDNRNQLSELENMRMRPATAALSAATLTGGKLPSASASASMVARGVPLTSVADMRYTSGASSIRRTNGQRRLVVTAEVQTAVANANDIVRHLESDYFPQLQEQYRDVDMSFRGDQQDFRDAIDSLYISFPLAVIGIFIIIATIFRSYFQPLVILITVPFGICGAIFGHLLLGHNLTMLSVFGLVALAGVVVNDAIVLIECINTYIAEGESFYEAVRRGGARRFRAIFLTTITTVGGLAPLLLERDRQAQPLIPMAISLAFGIAFATLITLFLVPCVLCILNDGRRTVHFLFQGFWPAPEAVEPARQRSVEDIYCQ